MCPDGWKLDIDWKTCVQEGSSYDNLEEEDTRDMACDHGYEHDRISDTCVDIDECNLRYPTGPERAWF